MADYTELDRKLEYYHSHKHLIAPEVSAKYAAAFRVEYAHNSTAIEGNTLSLIETKLLLEDKLSVGGKELREIFEVTNHARAFDYACKRTGERMPLIENIVKDIHQILMENIFPGGIYRNVNVRIVGAGFTPPEPNEMYVEIKNFFADLPYKTDIPSIELAAWVHAEFVRIHPFQDGNGRIARMIMNYQLMLSDWLPVSVAKEDRLKYFEALEVYAVNRDLRPFAAFVAELENNELDRMIEVIQQSAENQQDEDDELEP
ncbi:MAG: Fic family protein [Oscillospiraceae bacterium]|jgi:Fic family protein|nr:Fic family protein [Oscillospiraceae bacterium]